MKMLKNGLRMAKLGNSRDKEIYKIVPKELARFNKLVEGHKKLLIAIGNL